MQIGPCGIGQIIGVSLVGRLVERPLLPQIGSKVRVRLLNSKVGSLGKVTKGTRGPTCLSIAIVNTSHLKKLLGNRRGHNPGTTGSGDQFDRDRTALAGHLTGNRVRLADLVAPIASSDRDDGQLGEDDGTSDGRCHFFGALHSETHVTVEISNGDERLETGSLTGAGLLLNGHDLQNVVLQ